MNGIIVIVIALLLLIYLASHGVSLLILAPALATLVALTKEKG